VRGRKKGNKEAATQHTTCNTHKPTNLVLDADQDAGDDVVVDEEGEETWDREMDYNNLEEDLHLQSWDQGWDGTTWMNWFHVKHALHQVQRE